jgi:MFS family permease
MLPSTPNVLTTDKLLILSQRKSVNKDIVKFNEEIPTASGAWFTVFILALLYCISYLDRQMLSLMVDPIRHDMGISDIQISMLQGLSFAILYALFGLPVGIAVDRYSRRLVIFVGVLIWSIGATGCGLASNFEQLLAARVMVGMGEGALAPAAFSMLGDLFDRRRLTFALAVYTVGATFGVSGSLALGGLLIEATENGLHIPRLEWLHPWQTVFVLTGAPGLLAAFLIFLVPEPVRRSMAAKAGWPELRRFIASNWQFLSCHFVGFSCMIACAYAYSAWTPTFLSRVYGWSPSKAALILAPFEFVVGIGSLLASGKFVDYLQRRGFRDAHMRYYAFASIGLLVSGLVAYRLSTPLGFFSTIWLAALATNMAAVAAGAIQVVTPPNLRGRVSAFYLLVTSLIGITTGPMLTALLTERMFGGGAGIAYGLSLTIAILAPIGFVAFMLGMRPMRDAFNRINLTAVASFIPQPNGIEERQS